MITSVFPINYQTTKCQVPRAQSDAVHQDMELYVQNKAVLERSVTSCTEKTSKCPFGPNNHYVLPIPLNRFAQSVMSFSLRQFQSEVRLL